MTYVLLLYGLAFIVLGVVLSLQARSVVQVLPASCLWLLAVFGFLHGAAEWAGMAAVIEGADSGVYWLPEGSLILTALSYAALLHFGIEVQISRRDWTRWARAVPAALLLVLTGVAALAVSADRLPTWDALDRYLLGLPAMLLAAASFFLEGPHQERRGSSLRTRRLMVAAAGAFAIYSVLAGLVVPRAGFFPASLVNAEAFQGLLGVPVELLRGACAFLIAALLSEIFVVESERWQAALQQLRAEAMAAVAHDLRSPVSTIMLTTEMMGRSLAKVENTERERAMLTRCKSSTRHLERMITDLLEVSSGETRRLELKKERMDLREFIHGFTERSAALLDGRSLRVITPDTLPAIEADPVRLEQILVNLLSNAGKYADPGTEVILAAEPRDGAVMVSVTNQGPGIPPDEVSRLFTPFFRSTAVKRGVPGLGLGLSIVKRLVEAHGGRVSVESEVGGLTVFRFVLPVAPVA